MKTSNATWLFLQKIAKNTSYSLPLPSKSPIVSQFGVVDNKEQTNIIR